MSIDDPMSTDRQINALSQLQLSDVTRSRLAEQASAQSLDECAPDQELTPHQLRFFEERSRAEEVAKINANMALAAGIVTVSVGDQQAQLGEDQINRWIGLLQRAAKGQRLVLIEPSSSDEQQTVAKA